MSQILYLEQSVAIDCIETAYKLNIVIANTCFQLSCIEKPRSRFKVRILIQLVPKKTQIRSPGRLVLRLYERVFAGKFSVFTGWAPTSCKYKV